jgi:hypothetical protein
LRHSSIGIQGKQASSWNTTRMPSGMSVSKLEQRRFPAAGGPHHGEELALAKIEIRAFIDASKSRLACFTRSRAVLSKPSF